jgi:hypothetical protein
MEVCQNCGQNIGKMETPFVFAENVVCVTCYEKLNRASDIRSQTASVSRDRSKLPPWRRGFSSDSFLDFDKRLGYTLLVIFLIVVIIWIVWGEFDAFQRVQEWNSR